MFNVTEIDLRCSISLLSTDFLLLLGYAIVKLSPEVIKACQDMHIAMATFMKQSADEKAKFATKTDDLLYSPNQYHGYSKMKGLKEQFMVVTFHITVRLQLGQFFHYRFEHVGMACHYYFRDRILRESKLILLGVLTLVVPV